MSDIEMNCKVCGNLYATGCTHGITDSKPTTEEVKGVVERCIEHGGGITGYILRLEDRLQSLTEENQILRHELDGSAVNAGLVKQVAQQQQVMKEAVKVLQGVVDIMHGSDGVTGWHLNGDVATWDEFVEFITIHEALTKLKGEQGE